MSAQVSESVSHSVVCPWNSPGKNTGVDCHSFLQGIIPTQGPNLHILHCRQILYHLIHATAHNKIQIQSKSVSSSVMSNSLLPHGLYPPGFLCPWDSPGKDTGMGCHSLLQGIFLTQVLNLGPLHCRQIIYHLSYQGSPIGAQKSVRKIIYVLHSFNST